MQACIYGLAGPSLSDDERAFFKEADACGYILFARNIENREQLKSLTDELRTISGRADVPILIDQEGGRVARMRAPEWMDFPPMGVFEALYDKAPSSALEAARVNARALGLMLAEVGINVDCLPVLDVRQEGADQIVGDRSLASNPMWVASLGRAVIRGLHSAGVVSVVKHIPGHGRALVDSHKETPTVTATGPELDDDLYPFEKLNDAPMGMVAHVIYTAWDPDNVASQSPTVIGDIIRDRIGFDGFLMSDDINMEALDGDPGQRALATVKAGNDVALHCSGKLDEMKAIAAQIPAMGKKAEERLAAAMAIHADDERLDFAECIAKRDELLALA